MIMFEQSKRLSEPLRWGRREKAVVAVVLTCAALALAGVIAFAPASSPVRAGCIDVTFASTLGAAQVRDCGARAREACASPGAFRGVAREGLKLACEHAGYAFARQ
jgi:hypothetical protein